MSIVVANNGRKRWQGMSVERGDGKCRTQTRRCSLRKSQYGELLEEAMEEERTFAPAPPDTAAATPVTASRLSRWAVRMQPFRREHHVASRVFVGHSGERVRRPRLRPRASLSRAVLDVAE